MQLIPEGEVNSVDRYQEVKRPGIYPPLFTVPEGDRCFSIYQIRWIKKRFFNFFFWNFRKTTRNFSLPLQNSENPRIFRVTGANQSTQKLPSTDLVNTNNRYLEGGSNWSSGKKSTLWKRFWLFITVKQNHRKSLTLFWLLIPSVVISITTFWLHSFFKQHNQLTSLSED